MHGYQSQGPYLVQVVVGVDQLLQLALDVHQLLLWKLKLDQRNSRILEVLEEANFRWLQKDQASAFAVGAPCCPSNSVDIVSWIICYGQR
jgi:hypothetical protein